MKPLEPAQLAAALEDLPHWHLSEGKLHRKFKFDDFRQALAFMNAVGDAAEKANHHPEWFNVYNRVEVWLTTHDAGGITNRDLALARVMDSLV
jgi:4a-hydroxytetrahydrobiopterin dehydratase